MQCRRNKKGFYNIPKIHRLKLRWCRSAINSSCTVRSSISPFQGSFSSFCEQESTIPCSGVEAHSLSDGEHILVNNSTNGNNIEAKICSPNFWDSFRLYLKGFNNEKTIYTRISYARRFSYLLVNENFNEIHTLSKDKRNHVMKSLAALSKFLGMYDKWKSIVEKFNLKWPSEFNGLDAFKKIINSKNNLDAMVLSVRNALNNQDIPLEYRNLFLYCTLTGLRAAEAIESVSIIKNENLKSRYVSKDKDMIKHYEFPDIFIRATKKAYISIINDDIINLAYSCPNVNVNTFRSFFSRRKIPLIMNYCRKIFATFLRIKNIEPEIIDLLQGRIPKSIFLRHYYRPNINEIITDKIRPVLDSLLKELS